jgi:hypothetical protein
MIFCSTGEEHLHMLEMNMERLLIEYHSSGHKCCSLSMAVEADGHITCLHTLLLESQVANTMKQGCSGIISSSAWHDISDTPRTMVFFQRNCISIFGRRKRACLRNPVVFLSISMSQPQHLAYVTVQPDWQTVIQDVCHNTVQQESFWVSCYCKCTYFETSKGLEFTINRVESH